MSGNYDTRCSFTLGKNNKGDNPRRPDYRGELIDENGVVWELSGWIREQRNDKTKKFISGKLRKKETRQYDQHPDDAPPKQAPAPKPPAPSDFLS